MTRATGIASLCCALVSCQAFHIPTATTSSAMSWRRQGARAQCSSSSRRPWAALSMKEEATTVEKDNQIAAAAVAGKDNAAAKDAGEEERKILSREDLYKNQPKPRDRKPWNPAEQQYLDKMANAPIIYKRIPEQEFYPSVGYESSYPTLEESLKATKKATGDSMAVNEDGTEEILMRVVVVGGGEEEGAFLQNLAEQGAGKLVDGLYVLWDPREGVLCEQIANIKRINVHELGSLKTKDPAEVAKHACFLAANMLVAVGKHPSYGDDYVPRLKQAALDKGLTFVGPDLAAEVAKGVMDGFTKLVQATREALAED